MSEELFTARPVDGGVQVDMSKKIAKSWATILRLLARSGTPGALFFTVRWPWLLTRPALLRRICPDMTESRRESEAFRRRHREVLIDAELAERVLDRWEGPRPFVLTPADVDEWIVVMGQARNVGRLLPIFRREMAFLGYVQHHLVLAVDPEAFSGPSGEPVAAEEAATDQNG